MVEQNLFLCLLFSALAAIFTIAGKVVVLQLARRRKAMRQEHSQERPRSCALSLGQDDDVKVNNSTRGSKMNKKWETYWILTCFLVFQIIANGCIFVAPWFGPVSIYWPAYIASQLLSNMLIVGTCLQHERFDKPAQIATLVVVAAVLYITITGPGEPQEEQDIKVLVGGNWFAMIWLGLLCLIFSVSFLVMLSFLIGNCRRRKQPKNKEQQQQQQQQEGTEESASNNTTPRSLFASPLVIETVLLLVSTTCSVLSATASKAASTLTEPQDAPLRTGLIALTWIIIICWSLENYLEGRHVRSLGRFLPAMTFGSILLNAATGLIVWGDARVVSSWAGYATALCLLGMGVYLISDLDFFKAQIEEQQDYQRQIETWQDLFGELEEDLHRARVEQSLSRHQRTIRSFSSAHGLTRGNSDPELGTRSRSGSHMSYDSSSGMTSSVVSGSPLSPKSASSFASSSFSVAPPPPKSGSSFASIDLSSPIVGTRKMSGGGSSDTDRTLHSLERLSTSIRNFQEQQQHQHELQSHHSPNKRSSLVRGGSSSRRFSRSRSSSMSPIIMSRRRLSSFASEQPSTPPIVVKTTASGTANTALTSSTRTSKTSRSFSSSVAASELSGHSRDSSIWESLDGDADQKDQDAAMMMIQDHHDYGFVVRLEEDDDGVDGDLDVLESNMLPPPPPPINRRSPLTPRRSAMMNNPRRQKMMVSSPTITNLHKHPHLSVTPPSIRALSWDDSRLDEDSGEDEEDEEADHAPVNDAIAQHEAPPSEESSRHRPK